MNGLSTAALAHSQSNVTVGIVSGGPPQISGLFARCDKNVIQQGSILTRSVLVNITGSLANLAMQGTQAGVWRPVEGMQLRVFGLGADADTQIATNQLRTALVHEVAPACPASPADARPAPFEQVKLLEHRSTFPVPLGVNVECVPPNEKTDMGDGYAYTVLPQSTISTPHTLYQCNVDAEEGNQWRKDYPKYNSANIETEGVMDVERCPYVFVHQEHPVITLLRNNSNLIGCNIDEQPKLDNEWFKVSRQVLSVCCQTLREHVLNRVASNDLNLFHVQLFRLNAQSWDDINDVNLPLQNFVPDTTWDAERVDVERRAHVERFLSTPYNYTARISIKYEIQSPQ